MDRIKYYRIEKLPTYWDITNWAIINVPNLIMIFRDIGTGRRVLKVINLIDGTISYEMNTYFNIILGSTNETNILLSRIDDARSHDQLSRLSCFNLIEKAIVWQAKEDFIVEKYSTPRTIYKNKDEYHLGKKIIKLQSGEVVENANTYSFNKDWEIGDYSLRQQEMNLYAQDKEGNAIWFKENYRGKWFQGAIKGRLYFLLPDERQLVILNEVNGQEVARICLTDIKQINDHTNGEFDYYNDISYRNSFIADLLVSEKYIVWITETNELAISDYTNTRYYNVMANENTFLCSINNDYVLAIRVNETDQNGDLLIINLEELINE